MGALLGLHPFYVRTGILFDLLHGLHNVFPLSLQMGAGRGGGEGRSTWPAV